MKNTNIQWLIGDDTIATYPRRPYDDLVIDFLDDLSVQLRKNSYGYSDIMTLAFWCRRSNITRMKQQALNCSSRLGRGLIFHITPSNVPINFAFSYFFGLLSGNSNIVRVPSKEYEQITIICNAIKELFKEPKYETIRKGTAFIRYAHEKEITDELCSMADGRIIWGGDATIDTIRQSAMKPKGIEVVFADRYSFGILNSEALMSMDQKACERLAHDFYNDTYLMDQNACSSPHFMIWTGHCVEEAKERFWNTVAEEAERYDLEPIKAVDKYTDVCSYSIELGNQVKNIKSWGNKLYTIDFCDVPQDITGYRGRFGLFFQCTIASMEELAPCINEKIQTLLYYGVDKQELLDFVLNHHLMGIDRIVPFGQSLNMDVLWDGYDIVSTCSRQIDVQ